MESTRSGPRDDSGDPVGTPQQLHEHFTGRPAICELIEHSPLREELAAKTESAAQWCEAAHQWRDYAQYLEQWRDYAQSMEQWRDHAMDLESQMAN